MQNEYRSRIWKYYLFRLVASIELTGAIYVLFMLQNELSMTAVMMLEIIFIAGTLLLQIPAGAFADFYGRKISLVISLIFTGIGFIIYGIGTTFEVFLLASIAMSFSFAFYFGANSAFLYDTLKQLKSLKQYPKVLGRAGFIEIAVLSVASLVGTAIAPYTGYRLLFFITAASFISGALIAFFFTEPKRSTKLRDTEYMKHMKEAIKFTWSHPAIKNLIIYFSIFGTISHLAWFILQPYFASYSISDLFVGIGMFAYFLPFGLGLLYAEKIIPKVKPKKLIHSLLIISGICFSLMYLPFPWLSLILVGIMSFTCGIRDILVDKEINHHTSSHRRATVMSLQSFTKYIMYGALAPLLGISADKLGSNNTILIMGITLIVFFFLVIFLFRKVKL